MSLSPECHEYMITIYKKFIANILYDPFLMNGWEADVRRLVEKRYISAQAYLSYQQDVGKLRLKLRQYYDRLNINPKEYIDFSNNKILSLNTTRDFILAFESVYTAYEGAFRGIFRLLQTYLDPELEKANKEMICALRPLESCTDECAPTFSFSKFRNVCGVKKI